MTFTWRSRGTYLSLLNPTLLITVALIVAKNTKDIFSPLASEAKWSSTEATGQLLVTLMKYTTVLYLYSVAIADRNRLISLWNNINRTTKLISFTSSMQAEDCFKSRLSKIQGTGKLYIAIYFVLSVIQSFTEAWPVIPLMVKHMQLWRAALCTVSLLWLNLVQNMYVTFAFIFVTFTKILGTGFVVLTHQLKEIQVEEQLASIMVASNKEKSRRIINKRSVLRLINLGKQLEALNEEFNGSMKIPFVIMLVSIVINLTISVFFTAVVIERNQFTVDSLSIILSALLCMAPLQVLCSTGSELTSSVSFLSCSSCPSVIMPVN